MLISAGLFLPSQLVFWVGGYWLVIGACAWWRPSWAGSAARWATAVLVIAASLATLNVERFDAAAWHAKDASETKSLDFVTEFISRASFDLKMSLNHPPVWSWTQVETVPFEEFLTQDFTRPEQERVSALYPQLKQELAELARAYKEKTGDGSALQVIADAESNAATSIKEFDQAEDYAAYYANVMRGEFVDIWSGLAEACEDS